MMDSSAIASPVDSASDGRRGSPELKILRNQEDISDVSWDQFVAGHADASIYHLSVWRKIIRDVFNHDLVYLMALDREDRVRGVFPMVRQRSRLFGHFLTSVPLVNYGGVLADSPKTELRLLKAGQEIAESTGAQHLCVRNRLEGNYPLPCSKTKVGMYLTLPADTEALWSSFKSKLRSQIRRAMKADLQVRHGHLDLLDGFYQVFSRNMRDLGTPTYAKKFFYSILDELGNHASITLVQSKEEVIAGGFNLKYRQTMEVPWASSLREFNHLAPNMLLYWGMLQRAVGEECTCFDFGRSTVDAGTHRFKAQWGAQPKQLYWYYWVRDGREIPAINPENPKYRFLTSAWQRLPLAIANRLGPHIVRNIP